MSSRMGQPATQWDGQNFSTDMDWTDIGIRTVEQPPNMINQATPTIVPVLAEEVLQVQQMLWQMTVAGHGTSRMNNC